MSQFAGLSPAEAASIEVAKARAAKDAPAADTESAYQPHRRHRGEGSARTLDRLAEQHEGWGDADVAADLRDQAASIRDRLCGDEAPVGKAADVTKSANPLAGMVFYITTR